MSKLRDTEAKLEAMRTMLEGMASVEVPTLPPFDAIADRVAKLVQAAENPVVGREVMRSVLVGERIDMQPSENGGYHVRGRCIPSA